MTHGETVRGRLDRGDRVGLAWVRRAGHGPTIVFLPGFASDMNGTKALALDAWAEANGRPMLRFDYSGHGASDGDFANGTIGRWTEDARQVIEAEANGRILLVGSSMGGWIALLLARKLGERVIGLVGVAAAPDFTERLMWDAMAPAERKTLMTVGVLHIPGEYGAPLQVTKGLIDEGRKNLVLDAPIAFDGPVRLMHGQRDPDVPWEYALKIAGCVTSDDVQVLLLKDGDHRLNREQDLALLCRTVGTLLGEDGGQALAV